MFSLSSARAFGWFDRFRTFRARRFHLGLRAKLALLILALFIPFLTLEAVHIYARFERYTENELEASRELATITGAAFMNYLETIWHTEQAIGSAAYFRDLPVESGEAATLLREQLFSHPTLLGFILLDADGAVIGATDGRRHGLALAGFPYVQRVLRGGNEVISELFEDNFTGEPTIVVARAIRRQGRLLGIVAANVDPNKLDLVLPLTRSGKSSFGLIDRIGTVVYHNIHPDDHRRIPSSSPVWLALRGEQVLAKSFSAGFDGSRRMGAFVPISGIGWATVVSAPVNQVLARAWSDTDRDIVVLLVISAISIFGVILAGRSFRLPAVALQRAATSISQGNLNARTDMRGTDELAVAAQTFDSMAERIQELETARTSFVKLAAHELRDPMATLKGICSLLTAQVGGGDPAAHVLATVDTLKRELDRLLALLNEVVETLLIQAGRLALKGERVDLTDVVAAALQPFLATQSKHRFVADQPDDKVWVWGDSQRLGEVMRNLIGNAVKYSPHGGEIRLALQVRDNRAVISVKDHGIGIPRDQLSRIFEGFYRASNAVEYGFGGMGLGLYICKDIADRHGARLWAESEEGAGSTFCIEFPLDRAELALEPYGTAQSASQASMSDSKA